MKIKLHSGKTEEISIESISVEGLLRQLGISQSEVLVVMNGEVIPEDRILDNEAQVRIIHVVFGG
ncbi:sulfur carrier protein ThiS [Methanolobus chelungpuianus]|uniref:Sulfur transfer protein involved in thiamine biosynthesis n=1 Tax=Methanolobus chelungpuianus TaxID=502115 RepID=A0AAE3KYH3_9EURY|nr:MoaD/ThiS family protein [Methanolobus chelungpuianus]MCQ6962108.1 sulfur transfer protein involved in thiamine biosynthesis [Methanolobus chelungpuianus]